MRPPPQRVEVICGLQPGVEGCRAIVGSKARWLEMVGCATRCWLKCSHLRSLACRRLQLRLQLRRLLLCRCPLPCKQNIQHKFACTWAPQQDNQTNPAGLVNFSWSCKLQPTPRNAGGIWQGDGSLQCSSPSARVIEASRLHASVSWRPSDSAGERTRCQPLLEAIQPAIQPADVCL